MYVRILPPSLQTYKQLPYDAYCTTVSSVIAKRMCQKCGLYHASITSMHAHARNCGTQEIVPKLRPVRIAARRQRELMAIIAAGEFEDAEWVDEDMADVSGLDVLVQETSIVTNTLPIVDITTRLHASPWLSQ